MSAQPTVVAALTREEAREQVWLWAEQTDEYFADDSSRQRPLDNVCIDGWFDFEDLLDKLGVPR